MLQVRNIFQLYADIEHTSRNNSFYEKYNLRYSMGDLLRECLLPLICIVFLTTSYGRVGHRVRLGRTAA